MKHLKFMLVFLLLTCISGISFAQQSISVQTIIDKQHPRILMLKGEEGLITQTITGHPVWKKMHEAILNECDIIITLPPIERIQIGRRLLDKSREALRRIFYLSYAWRLTGQEKYLQRCEKEMLAISRFSDWNPSHFLDVAEMTMAVSIGYDWLYDHLSAESRQIIREAIVNKGINPSLDPKNNSWLKDSHNWNQVCNGGMTYGALAVAEDYPDLSKQIIDRALQSIRLPMEEYKPDGAYPEGYGYWGYGTSFNVMFLSAMEKVFSTDFGLSSVPGFLKTSWFLENMTGPTGLCFNFSDSGSGGDLSPAMFWFAQKNNDPSLLWVEKSYLAKENYRSFTDERLLPAIMIWSKELPMADIVKPLQRFYLGQGANSVCMMRTSWSNPESIYLAFKAGSPSVNHGHMDIGSFMMEADGVRWASDFGMQNYESLESKGIQVFGRTQDAQRWSIFRINNFAHNTLTVDNQLQLVKGFAKIDKYSDQPDFMYAISDLSTVYEGQLAAAKRGVALVDLKYVVIADELKSGSKPAKVRWTMLTSAKVELGKNSLTLTREGKKLVLKVNTSIEVSMKTWTTLSPNSYDAPNPGTTLVGFELELAPNQAADVQVLLIPGSVENMKFKSIKPLADW
ncbi:MAG: heparinase II/III family protein [Bacteroidia bacterium]|nr:heparinase II/III family protein [Bacteroidia bacterium]